MFRLFSNCPRIRRWAFFGIAACLSVSTIAWTCYSYWRWNRVGQIPDIGDPFDVEAWLPRNLPDDENAAVVYRQAFALLGTATAALPDGTPLWDQHRKPPVADDNLFLQVTAAISQLLRQAAEMPEALFFRPQDATIENFDTEFMSVREVLELIQARARILRARGEIDEAMLDLISVVAVARHYPVKGNAMMGITANAVESLALDSIRDCAPGLLRSVARFEDRCDPLPSPNAHRGQAVTRSAISHKAQ